VQDKPPAHRTLSTQPRPCHDQTDLPKTLGGEMCTPRQPGGSCGVVALSTCAFPTSNFLSVRNSGSLPRVFSCQASKPVCWEHPGVNLVASKVHLGRVHITILPTHRSLWVIKNLQPHAQIVPYATRGVEGRAALRAVTLTSAAMMHGSPECTLPWHAFCTNSTSGCGEIEASRPSQ
jgi:hypothetical protein